MTIKHVGARILIVLAIAATLLSPPPLPAAAGDDIGCCCIGSGAARKCSETTQKACLAKQPAPPEYTGKTGWEKAEAESKAQEKGKMDSGWMAGKCKAE